MGVLSYNFLSRTLGMQTDINVILPTFTMADGMDKTLDQLYPRGVKYQTIYLLHGGSGDSSDYINFSNIVRYAEANKVAVVMPSDYNMRYVDHPSGAKYFSFIVDELPAVCQAIFPLSAKREDNFVAGLSMGSGGAFKAAALRPEQYAAALIMSGGIAPGDGSWSVPKMSSPIQIEWPIPPSPKEMNPDEKGVLTYIEQSLAEGKTMPKIFITWGDRDRTVREYSKNAVAEMERLGIDYEAEEVPGYAHEWPFWEIALNRALNEWLPLKRAPILPEA